MIGQTLGHCRIVAKIGAGGMGEVYRARDEQLDRDVAVKVLPAGTLGDEAARKQFRKEALALAKLNHPNIETVHEFGTQDGLDFLVMELIQGSTLTARLAEGPLSERDVLRLGIQLADGLIAAHAQGVIHRDLKPGNLIITPDGRLKILDFGLARLVHPEVADDITLSITVEAGTISGTIPYMAPEQLRALPADARSDIYAAGAVLYEMATGSRPFPERQSAELIGAILHRTPAPPSSLNPSIAPTLDSLILKALEKEPSQRYQSARELLVVLEGLSTSTVRSSVAAPAALSGVPRRSSRRLLLGGVAAVVLLGLAIGAWLRYGHKRNALGHNDTIVLADFANGTGDPVFNDALRQGLAVQLEQSPFLSLISEKLIQQNLRLMGQSPDARLTPELARDLCQRAGSKAYIAGSISNLGKDYLIAIHAVNCATGDSLAQQQVQATGKERVLDALGRAAAKIREELGESISTVQQLDTPLAQATTPSLEALQAYSLGQKAAVGVADDAAAVPLFKRAIELDPRFAMAYASLGSSYSNLGETTLASANASKAYELGQRVSDREKFFIESEYYQFAVGNLEKARQANELWRQMYPRDVEPWINLGIVSGNLGQYETTLADFREPARLGPDGVAYAYLTGAYMYANRPVEARATAAEAQAKKLDSPALRFYLYQLAFVQNDSAGMAEQVVWSSGKPGVEDVLLFFEAETHAYFGRLAKAREFSRRAVAAAARVEEKETAAGYEAADALREALFGNSADARQHAAAAIKLSTGRDVQFGAALALALAGDTARAQALADGLAKRFPEDTLVQFNYLPTLSAQFALNRANASKAIDALQAAAPYELGLPSTGTLNLALYPVYFRGEALLAAHRGNEAAAEFQKILDRPGVMTNEVIGALAHLGIARADALQGDAARARTAYQDFFTLWKDADPEIPILREAKTEGSAANSTRR
jgi:tRNA A-37 threonylcarbamoyl transferase component Bud32